MTLRRDIVVRRADGDHDLTIIAQGPELPFGQVLLAVGLEPGACHVDGRLVPATASLRDARLRSGSIVEAWSRTETSSKPVAIAVIEQVAGLHAGGTVPLEPGDFVVGPTALAGFDVGVPDEVAFRLTVDGERRVSVAPAELSVRLGGRTLLDREQVGTDVLSVDGCSFVVRPIGVGAAADGAADVEPAGRAVHDARSDRFGPVPVRAAVAGRRRSGWWLLAALLMLATIASFVVGPVPASAPVVTAAAVLGVLWWMIWRRERVVIAAADAHRTPPGSPTAADDVASPAAYDRDGASGRWRERPDRAATLRGERPNIAQVVAAANRVIHPVDGIAAGPALEAIVAYGGHDAVGPPVRLDSVPVIADLSRGPLAICGPRPAVLACAQAIVITCASASRPAQLTVALGRMPETPAEWDWLKWLPHVRSTTDSDASPFVILDGIPVGEAMTPFGRQLMAGHTTGIVLTPAGVELPAFCRQVLDVDHDGSCTFRVGEVVSRDLTAVGVDHALARDTAIGLCRTVDHVSNAEIEDGIQGARTGPELEVRPYALSPVDALS